MKVCRQPSLSERGHELGASPAEKASLAGRLLSQATGGVNRATVTGSSGVISQRVERTHEKTS
jgi:hypothetical protein